MLSRFLLHSIALFASIFFTHVALAAPSEVSGVVKNAITGEPVPLANVGFYLQKDDGTFPGRSDYSVTTDRSGQYVVSISEGHYKIIISEFGSYFSQVYGGASCRRNCSDQSGALFIVESGQKAVVPEVLLMPWSRISGKVTDDITGEPISGVVIDLYSSDEYLGSVITNDNGEYTTNKGQLAFEGEVYLWFYVENDSPYIDYQVSSCAYSDMCKDLENPKVGISTGLQLTNVDFTLSKIGVVFGRVTDELTGEPLSDVVVYLDCYTGYFINTSDLITDVDGRYSSLGNGRPFGQCTLRIKEAAGYLYEHSDGLPYYRGTEPSSSDVTFGSGQVIESVDFALLPSGVIQGKVTDAITSVALLEIKVNLWSRGDYFWSVIQSVVTDVDGNYKFNSNLHDGDYYVSTDSDAYLNEVYGGKHCAGGCNRSDFESAELISLKGSEVVDSVDFTLDQGARISGKITRLTSNEAIKGAYVILYDEEGSIVAGGETDSLGNYQSDHVLPSGRYFLIASHDDFIRTVYGGGTCLNCDVTTAGGALVITGNTDLTGINLSLLPGGGISGLVASQGTSQLSGSYTQVYIDIYAKNNLESPVLTVWSRDGDYYDVTSQLPSGDYYIQVSSAEYDGHYISSLYGGVECQIWKKCDFSQAQTVSVIAGEITQGIDILLLKGGAISGVITDLETGAFIEGAQLWVCNDVGLLSSRAETNENGEYTTSANLPSDNYYIVAWGEEFQFRSFGSVTETSDYCGSSWSEAITVTQGEVTTGVDIQLIKAGRISGKVIDQQTGNGANRVEVEVYNALGVYVRKGLTDFNGEYLVSDLDAGDYYLSLKSTSLSWGNEYFNYGLYGGLVCGFQPSGSSILGCDVLQGTPVSVVSREVTEGIDFYVQLNGDNDRDGIPDEVELATGLNPDDPSDAILDLDEDGINNIKEYQYGTDLSDNASAAPFLVVSNLESTEVGWNPLINPFRDQSRRAWNNIWNLSGSELSYQHNLTEPLPPGEHIINWTVSDTLGNEASFKEYLKILPVVNFAVDQVVGEGGQVRVTVLLNGESVTYPVEIHYEVSGTATYLDDHNVTSGKLIIESGYKAEILFDVIADDESEADETIVFTMKVPGNVVIGEQKRHTVMIAESHLPPRISLRTTQADELRRTVVAAQGDVSVVAQVNGSDESYSFDWSASDNRLIDSDNDQNNAVFQFDPKSMAAGIYHLKVQVQDSVGETAEATVMLNLQAKAPELSSELDQDKDGVNDSNEGFGDSDGDGLANHLDRFNLPNWLQSDLESNGLYLLYTQPGLTLSLGHIAFASTRAGVRVEMSDVIDQGGLDGRLADSESGTGYKFPVGVHDFRVGDLPKRGESHYVVIPLTGPIPAEANYRHYSDAFGWQTWIEDENNKLSSFKESDVGTCFAAGHSAYKKGLTEGHYCIQLMIEDGGPNDADGVVNGVISVLGGVSVRAVTQAVPEENTQQEAPEASKSGGGGVTSLMGLFLLVLVCYRCGLHCSTGLMNFTHQWRITYRSVRDENRRGRSVSMDHCSQLAEIFRRDWSEFQTGNVN